VVVAVGSCIDEYFVGQELGIMRSRCFNGQENMGFSVLVFFVVMVVGLSS